MRIQLPLFLRLKNLQLLLAVMTLLSTDSYAQYEKLLSKNPKERRVAINETFDRLVGLNYDPVATLKEINILRDFAKSHNDFELELQTDLAETARMVRVNMKAKQFSETEILNRYDQLLQKATENNFQQLKLRVLLYKSGYCWDFIQNYELAFETYFVLDKELEKVSSDEFPKKSLCMIMIGEAYFFFQDYTKAKEYFQKGLKIPENNRNSTDLNSMRNDLGLCCQKLNQLDSSIVYFKKAINSKPYFNHELWVNIAKGNLGNTYYMKKEYDKAIPLLKADIKGSMKFKEYGCVSGSLKKLADIYLIKGRIKEAKECLDKERALTISYFQDRAEGSALNLYPIMSRYYQLTGNKDLAIKYLDSLVIAKERHYKRFNALQLSRAQQKNALQEHRLAALALANEEQKKANKRNIILLVLTSLFIVFFGAYYFQKKKHRRENRIQDLKLTIVRQDLQFAEQRLKEFTDELLKKNDIIELIQKQSDTEADTEVLQQIKQTTILTTEDWDRFQHLFEKVHSGFLHRLTNKYKELTASEIRYITLAKLHLSQKEMANILGISPDSVRVTWHRVGKKLSLTDKDKLENFLNEL